MTGRAAIHACSIVLAHAPDLVRHGSKPARELAADANGLLDSIARSLRAYDDVLGYPPHQALIGNLRPDALWEVPRPWWNAPVEPRPEGPFGVVVDQAELYRRMQEADAFGLFKLDGSPAPNGGLTIDEAGKAAGSMAGAHDLDETLSASVLLENLACKATGALALEHLLRTTGVAPEDVPYVIGCGEEAVGDRYQRGGGNLAKAIAEQAGLPQRFGQRREGVLLRAGARARRRRVAGGLGRLPARRRARRRLAGQAGDEVLRRAPARHPDPRGRSRRLRRARGTAG